MYEKYNSVLRFFTGETKYKSGAELPFLQTRCEELGLGSWKDADGLQTWSWANKYTTTLHAINSCVLKLTKLTKAQPVYRGSTGATLPESFFTPNKDGVCGGVEYGFTSSTVDPSQARSYAEGQASTVFEMQMGMIDRGADMSWLSQYPLEKEILFPPLMGLEVLGTRVDVDTLVVDAKLSLNLTALTLDQVLGKRRKVVGDMCEQLALKAQRDAEDEKWYELREAVGRFVTAKLEPLAKREREHYNENGPLGVVIADSVALADILHDWLTKLEAFEQVRLHSKFRLVSTALTLTNSASTMPSVGPRPL
jgi:hypothetical protein